MRLLSNAEYVRDEAGKCPFCASRNICAIEPMRIEDGIASRAVECHDCGKLWRSNYKLIGYTPDVTQDQYLQGSVEHNMHECQNCSGLWHTDELHALVDIFERVAPGEIMPSGECPDCGAVCHPLED